MPRFREGLAELQAFYERILEAFGASDGVWLGTPFNLNLERESGARERRMAGDLASAFGVVGREGWLDCACRSQDDGSSHASG